MSHIQKLAECRGTWEDAFQAMKDGYTVHQNVPNAPLYRIADYEEDIDKCLFFIGTYTKYGYRPKNCCSYYFIERNDNNEDSWTIWNAEDYNMEKKRNHIC